MDALKTGLQSGGFNKTQQRAPSEAPPESPIPTEETATPCILDGKFEYQSGAKYLGEYHIVKGVKLRHGFGKYTHPSPEVASVSRASWNKPPTRQPTQPSHISQPVSGLTTPMRGTTSVASSAKILGDEGNVGTITEEYDGEWCEDNIHGYGVYKYKNGDVYDGYWDNNLYNGQGTYTFANGAKYVGEWANNRMHGIVTYTEESGVEWSGIFINGSFDSGIQKSLNTDRIEIQKVQEVESQVETFLNYAKNIFDNDESEWKMGVVQLLGYMHPDEVLPHVTEPFVRYEAFKLDVWQQIIDLLLEGEIRVLKKPADATIIAADRIASVQLNGTGQIVEIVNKNEESTTNAVIMNISEDQDAEWCILLTSHEKVQEA